jgi:hypothetical protein
MATGTVQVLVCPRPRKKREHKYYFVFENFINGTLETRFKKARFRKPDLRKNLDLRKIVATTDFLVHKLFDLRKIF